MNAKVLVVIAVIILVMGPIAVFFNICRVRTFVYYLVFPPMMLVAGYANAWAFGATGDMVLVITAIGGLLGVQVAWVLTTRIPRP
jgi:hypothetical protein